MIFTDGSYSPKSSPLSTLFDHAPTDTQAAGSVVLYDASGSHTPIAFYIANGQAIGVDSAPSMELVSLYAALVLRAHLTFPIPIYTDSKTSLDQLQSPLRYADPKSAGYTFVHMGHVLIDKQGGPIRKVAAHPEKITRVTGRWNKFMWGNHIADAVASKGPRARLLGTPVGMRTPYIDAIPIQSTVVAESASVDIPFYWSMEPHNHATIRNLNNHHASVSMKRYLSNREMFSADIGRNSSWQDTSAAFAARCWDLAHLPLTNRAASLRIMWDKGMHGGNRSKGAQYTAQQKEFLARCTVCATEDSADHWIRRCPHASMMQYRAECLDSVKNYITSIKTEAAAKVLRKILAIAVHDPLGYRVWTANWPLKLQQELQPWIAQACRFLSMATLKKHVVSVHRIFITTLKKMWVLKTFLPIHLFIANRLEGAYAHLSRLYHGPRTVTQRPLRYSIHTRRTRMKHRNRPRTLAQQISQERNSRAKEARAARAHVLLLPLHTPCITNYFFPVAPAQPAPRIPRDDG